MENGRARARWRSGVLGSKCNRLKLASRAPGVTTNRNNLGCGRSGGIKLKIMLATK